MLSWSDVSVDWNIPYCLTFSKGWTKSAETESAAMIQAPVMSAMRLRERVVGVSLKGIY